MRGAAALAAAAAALLLGCRVSVPFAERLFFEHESRPAPRAKDCERCHQEVYREWRESAHARAWTSPAFRRASAERRAPECLGCHAPAPLEAERRPRLREAHREEGVTCVTCHLSASEGAASLTMRGPVSRSSPVEVHPVIEEDPLYQSSELCGGCHRGAFAEWRDAPPPAEGEKPTCQGCHMPSVHRTVESVHDEHAYSRLFVALEDEMELRRHLFAVPEDAEEHLALRARLGRAAGRRAVLATVSNGLPHALPTGRFGRHAVELRVAWPGGERSRELASARGDALPAGAERALAIPLPEGVDPARIRVTLRRWEGGDAGWSELVQVRVEPPPVTGITPAPPRGGG